MSPIERRSVPCVASASPSERCARSGPTWFRALDFQFDQTTDGRMLKLLNVINEYTRECLAIDVGRSIDADGVVTCLERLAQERVAPAYVRFDHSCRQAEPDYLRPALLHDGEGTPE